MVDIDANDIESVEIVKGAAAASLYGSRASAGVVQITTSRGRDVAENSTRILVRSEYGTNRLDLRQDYITNHHYYKMTADGSSYADANGSPVGKADRVADGDLIEDNPYPGQTYDNLRTFFNPGEYLRTSVSIAQNTRSTNFMASFNTQNDKGIIQGLCDAKLFADAPGGVPDGCGNDGAQLYGLRLNLDHRLRDDLNFSVSSYYSRYRSEGFRADPLYDLMFVPPDVNLLEPNPDGEPFLIQPDQFSLQENPLYGIAYGKSLSLRSRYSTSLITRYSPANWFSLETNVSFDRSDRHGDGYTPKGFKTLTSESNGSISRSNNLTQALNANLTASVLKSFGDLTTRTKVQYLLERETNDGRSAAGNTFAVKGVEDVDVSINESAGSSLTDVKSAGYFVITGLDYKGKYVAEGLARRDGSSLFGPEDRWHWYYRGSGAWRMSEEDWWPIQALNEFKLRYSIGTAGGRPGFSDRYETWSVSSGSVSKGTLGNKQLRPELQTEQEVGIDMIMNDRHSLQLVYAKSKVQDQLLSVPLPAVYGYSSQWQNAGTIESSTYEATLETTLLERPNLRWSMTVVADRTRSQITEFDRGCYTSSSIYYCAGFHIGEIRGYQNVTSISDLPGRYAGYEGEFQVNDDGLIVPVGAGNSYKDGISKGLWGTSVDVGGASLPWGIPIFQEDENGIVTNAVTIGNTNPDMHVGVTHNIQWKGFNFYGLVDAKIGGDIYNETKAWAYRDALHIDYDQSSKPEELRKPTTYYQKLYNTNSTSSWFVEDGTYVKLRDLSVTYAFNRDQLQRLFGGLGMERLTIGLIGRNLYTWTDFTGFDPEVGGIRSAQDNFGYPNFRTFTARVDVQF